MTALAPRPVVPTDDADRVAVEHLIWAAAQGLTARAAVEACGLSLPAGRVVTWVGAQLRIAALWRTLKQEETTDAPSRTPGGQWRGVRTAPPARPREAPARLPVLSHRSVQEEVTR